MGEALDSFQAALTETFAGVPVLLHLLMRLFALLRDAAARFALGAPVPVADAEVMPVRDDVQLVADVRQRAAGRKCGARTVRLPSARPVCTEVANSAVRAEVGRGDAPLARATTATWLPDSKIFKNRVLLPWKICAYFIAISKQKYLWIKFFWFFSFKKRTTYYPASSRDRTVAAAIAASIILGQAPSAIIT